VFERIGVRPLGHRTALWAATWRSPALVAEYGLLYDSTLMDDDRPYVLDTGKGRIVELPPHWSLDDWEQYAFLPEPNIGGRARRHAALPLPLHADRSPLPLRPPEQGGEPKTPYRVRPWSRGRRGPERGGSRATGMRGLGTPHARVAPGRS
jgi:hypothetical protein